jgi:hypothetical protein
MFFRPGALKWLKGEEQIRSFTLPEAKRFANNFCGVCGGRLPRQPQGADTVLIPAGSLDEEAPIKPQARIFFGSRASWSCAGDELPAYQELPPR